MKTKEFLETHSACAPGAKWALSISADMADVWDALVREKQHLWLLWVVRQPDLIPFDKLCTLGCRFIRETPLHDGRMVWDLLLDSRIRKVVELVELFARGEIPEGELAVLVQSTTIVAIDVVHLAYSNISDLDFAGTNDGVIRSRQEIMCNAHAIATATMAASKLIYGVHASMLDYAERAYTVDARTLVVRAATLGTDAVRIAAGATPTAAHAERVAEEAQVQMIADLGNPFKKGE